jgi:hypothetical protein
LPKAVNFLDKDPGLKDPGVMAAFTVTFVQLFAFWERILRLGLRLVVTVTATATASVKILGVVQLVLQGVAFLYVSEKRVI